MGRFSSITPATFAKLAAPHCTGCMSDFEPFEAAKAHCDRRYVLATGLQADSVTTFQPLPNLLRFIADEGKEFQASRLRGRLRKRSLVLREFALDSRDRRKRTWLDVAVDRHSAGGRRRAVRASSPHCLSRRV